MSQDNSHQKKVFDYLRTIIPSGKSLADVLSNILYISSDSAYRRIRGETPVTLDELKTICEHFAISADQLLELQNQNRVIFETALVSDASQSLKKYIQNIAGQLQYLLSKNGCHITYCSKDMPLFHFFSNPELMAFKFHFWMHVVAQDTTFKGKAFEAQVHDNEIRNLMVDTLSLYNRIPSIEVWNAESIYGTLFQIAYYQQTGLFASPTDATKLLNLLDEVLVHIENQASAGAKFLPGQNPDYQHKNFQLFYNQVSLADTILLAKAENRKIALINFGVLNYLTTEDPAFAQSLENDINNIIRRSTLLSEANERQRSKFFNTLHQRVDEQRRML